MISRVTFRRAVRCFAAGDALPMESPLVLVVGAHLSGKSTLLALLHARATGRPGATGIAPDAIDIQRDGAVLDTVLYHRGLVGPGNPRVAAMAFGVEVAATDTAEACARGTTDRILAPRPATLLLLDEPDVGASPARAVDLVRRMEAFVMAGGQVVAAVNHPWVIEGVPHVLSLDTGRWTASADFLRAQRGEGRP